MVAMHGEQKAVRGELNVISDEQLEAKKANDTLAERMNQIGDQLKQETCTREQAMQDMEARWQASQALFGKALEDRMERRLKEAMGDHMKGVPLKVRQMTGTLQRCSCLNSRLSQKDLRLRGASYGWRAHPSRTRISKC